MSDKSQKMTETAHLVMLLACRTQLRECRLNLLRGRRTLRDGVLKHLDHLLQRRRGLAVKVGARLNEGRGGQRGKGRGQW